MKFKTDSVQLSFSGNKNCNCYRVWGTCSLHQTKWTQVWCFISAQDTSSLTSMRKSKKLYQLMLLLLYCNYTVCFCFLCRKSSRKADDPFFSSLPYTDLQTSIEKWDYHGAEFCTLIFLNKFLIYSIKILSETHVSKVYCEFPLGAGIYILFQYM